MSERHRIGEAVFDIVFDSPRSVLRRDAELGAFIRDRLMPLLEQVLDEFGETPARIDRLTVDLGELVESRFETDMPGRFRDGLRAALRKALSSAAASAPHPATAARRGAAFGTDSVQAAPGQRELLLFLETGRIEGRPDARRAKALGETLVSLVRSDPVAFAEYLKRSPRREAILKRLASQFAEDILSEVVRWLVKGQTGAFPGKPDVPEIADKRGADWEGRLAAILDEDPVEASYRRIADRLSGKTRQAMTAALADIAKAHPALLRKWYSEVRAGTLSVAPETLAAAEARQLVLAVIGLEGESETAEFRREIERHARQAPDEAGYYRYILDSLAKGRVVDLQEAIGATATTSVPDNDETGIAAAQDVPAEADDSDESSKADAPAARAALLRTRLETALALGRPELVRADWEALRRQHPALVRDVFTRLMGDIAVLEKMIAGFDDALLLDILRVLLPRNVPLVEDALSEIPGHLARHGLAETARLVERTELWRYVFSQVHGLSERSFDPAAFQKGLADLGTQAARLSAEDAARLDGALTQGVAGDIAPRWDFLLKHHSEAVREAFARWMGDAGARQKVSLGFPEPMLLQLASLVSPAAGRFLALLAREPKFRSEGKVVSVPPALWDYALAHLHALAGQPFDQRAFAQGAAVFLAEQIRADGEVPAAAFAPAEIRSESLPRREDTKHAVPERASPSDEDEAEFSLRAMLKLVAPQVSRFVDALMIELRAATRVEAEVKRAVWQSLFMHLDAGAAPSWDHKGLMEVVILSLRERSLPEGEVRAAFERAGAGWDRGGGSAAAPMPDAKRKFGEDVRQAADVIRSDSVSQGEGVIQGEARSADDGPSGEQRADDRDGWRRDLAKLEAALARGHAEDAAKCWGKLVAGHASAVRDVLARTLADEKTRVAVASAFPATVLRAMLNLMAPEASRFVDALIWRLRNPDAPVGPNLFRLGGAEHASSMRESRPAKAGEDVERSVWESLLANLHSGIARSFAPQSLAEAIIRSLRERGLPDEVVAVAERAVAEWGNGEGASDSETVAVSDGRRQGEVDADADDRSDWQRDLARLEAALAHGNVEDIAARWDGLVARHAGEVREVLVRQLAEEKTRTLLAARLSVNVLRAMVKLLAPSASRFIDALIWRMRNPDAPVGRNSFRRGEPQPSLPMDESRPANAGEDVERSVWESLLANLNAGVARSFAPQALVEAIIRSLHERGLPTGEVQAAVELAVAEWGNGQGASESEAVAANDSPRQGEVDADDRPDWQRDLAKLEAALAQGNAEDVAACWDGLVARHAGAVSEVLVRQLADEKTRTLLAARLSVNMLHAMVKLLAPSANRFIDALIWRLRNPDPPVGRNSFRLGEPLSLLPMDESRPAKAGQDVERSVWESLLANLHTGIARSFAPQALAEAIIRSLRERGFPDEVVAVAERAVAEWGSGEAAFRGEAVAVSDGPRQGEADADADVDADDRPDWQRDLAKLEAALAHGNAEDVAARWDGLVARHAGEVREVLVRQLADEKTRTLLAARLSVNVLRAMVKLLTPSASRFIDALIWRMRNPDAPVGQSSFRRGEPQSLLPLDESRPAKAGQDVERSVWELLLANLHTGIAHSFAPQALAEAIIRSLRERGLPTGEVQAAVERAVAAWGGGEGASESEAVAVSDGPRQGEADADADVASDDRPDWQRDLARLEAALAQGNAEGVAACWDSLVPNHAGAVREALTRQFAEEKTRDCLASVFPATILRAMVALMAPSASRVVDAVMAELDDDVEFGVELRRSVWQSLLAYFHRGAPTPLDMPALADALGHSLRSRGLPEGNLRAAIERAAGRVGGDSEAASGFAAGANLNFGDGSIALGEHAADAGHHWQLDLAKFEAAVAQGNAEGASARWEGLVARHADDVREALARQLADPRTRSRVASAFPATMLRAMVNLMAPQASPIVDALIHRLQSATAAGADVESMLWESLLAHVREGTALSSGPQALAEAVIRSLRERGLSDGEVRAAAEHVGAASAAIDPLASLAEATYRRLLDRSKGVSDHDLTTDIAELAKSHPSALRDLTRKLHAQAHRFETDTLGAQEARQLALAIAGLEGEAETAEFRREIERHGEAVQDSARYYRHILGSLLKGEIVDLQKALDASSAGGDGREPSAMPAIQRDGADALLLRLADRLRGNGREPEMAAEIAQLADAAPTALRHLYRQLQSGGFRAQVSVLSAKEARGLVEAFIKPERGGDATDFQLAVEDHGRRARDEGVYYRHVLQMLIGGHMVDLEAAANAESAPPVVAPDGLSAALPVAQRPAHSPATEARPDSPASKAPSAFETLVTRPRDEDEPTEEVYISNAGIAIAAPYLPRLFGMLELTAEGKFKDEAAVGRAIHLVQYVVDGSCDAPEFLLVLNKLLCGARPAMPVPRRIELEQRDKDAVDGMLRAIIQNWTILGNTSVRGLQESFLQRAGRLQLKGEDWFLKVEQKGIDVLLDKLPWGISVIKYPWMQRMIFVEWR